MEASKQTDSLDRAQVLQAILSLEERFTVADVCLFTGLDSAAVRAQLEPLLEAGHVVKSNRPRLYQIASRAAGEELARQYAKVALPYRPSQAEVARREWIETELARIDAVLSGPPPDGAFDSALSARLLQVERELRRLTWESPEDFSLPENEHHQITQLWRLLRRLKERQSNPSA